MAEQAEFRLDARNSPKRVFRGDAPNERLNLLRNCRPSRFAARSPSPVKAKALVVPVNHGFGLHDDEPLLPIGEPARNENPKGPFPGAQLWPRGRAVQRRKLLTERENLRDQSRPPCEAPVTEQCDEAHNRPAVRRLSFCGVGDNARGAGSQISNCFSAANGEKK